MGLLSSLRRARVNLARPAEWVVERPPPARYRPDPCTPRQDPVDLSHRCCVRGGLAWALGTVMEAPNVRGVRRPPVIDGRGLVGMISQAGIHRNLSEDSAGDLVEAIPSAPATDAAGHRSRLPRSSHRES